MKKVVLLSACAAALAFCQSSYALRFELNEEFSGGSSPAGPVPWVVVEINNGAAGQVTISIQNVGLTSREFNSGTYLNVDSSVGVLNLVNAPTQVGTFNTPTFSQGNNAYSADGGGYYDLLFAFETSGNGNKRFGAGESITYTFSGTGLDENDFNVLSSPHGGHGVWHAAAHIQGIGTEGEGSGWIGDGTPRVPDGGSTLALLGLVMTGMGWIARRRNAK